MRKINAFILAGFYLLLSTGAFACLVHCTSELFFTDALAEQVPHGHTEKAIGSNTMAHVPHQHQPHHKKSKCGAGKDCRCCREHGIYVVRENVSPIAHDELIQPAILLPTGLFDYTSTSYVVSASNYYPRATGPLGQASIPLYLKFRSILI